eukprot:m51a1_g13655 hypothetical protein (400) ;mRNA; f:91-1290
MRAHRADPAVLSAACGALGAMGPRCRDQREVIDNAHEAMDACPDAADVQQYACEALWNNLQTRELQEYAASRGVARSVLRALGRSPPEPSVVETACGVLWELASHVGSDPRRPNAVLSSILSLGAPQAVRQARSFFDSESQTYRHAQHCLACLQREEDARAVAARRRGLCTAQPACGDGCYACMGFYCPNCSMPQRKAKCRTCDGRHGLKEYCELCLATCHAGHDVSELTFGPSSCSCALSKAGCALQEAKRAKAAEKPTPSDAKRPHDHTGEAPPGDESEDSFVIVLESENANEEPEASATAPEAEADPPRKRRRPHAPAEASVHVTTMAGDEGKEGDLREKVRELELLLKKKDKRIAELENENCELRAQAMGKTELEDKLAKVESDYDDLVRAYYAQ